MPLRPTAGLSLALAALPLAACAGPLNLPRAAATPTHMAAHQLCSAVFVSGVEPERYYREAVATNVAPVKAFLSHHVDRERREVTASFAGMIRSRAVYRGEAGCVVVQGKLPPAPRIDTPRPTPLLAPIAGPDVVAPTDPRLAAALDHVFAETDKPPHRYTKAVVVVRDGRVIAERYAPGYGPQTPIHGWSMTKSVTSSLVGILVRQGRLAVDQPAPVPEWQALGDPRRAITVGNLLHMQSGLDVGDSLTIGLKDAVSPSSQVLFAEPDMGAFIARYPLSATPGTRFTYANGDTLLLSRIVRDKVGGDGQAVLRFAHAELFDKVGLEHAVLEQDATGTPIGSSHMWASARDWARLGLFWMDDGVVGGERILPEGWVDYSTRLTPGSERFGYGAQFWTNRGASAGARNRPHMPPDSFMARGAHGQYTIVIPSKRLVIVRLGDAYTALDDIAAVDRLVGEVIAATDAPAA